MQKISGIIPGNRRVTSVDLNSSNPIRPGQPSFGRPVGRSGQSVTPGFATKDPLINHKDVMSIRDKGERHQAIVERVSNAFFMKGPKPAAANNDMAPVGPQPGELSVNNVAEVAPVGAEGPEIDDLDIPQIGYHLNVSA